jgi:hypothetical protein
MNSCFILSPFAFTKSPLSLNPSVADYRFFYLSSPSIRYWLDQKAKANCTLRWLPRDNEKQATTHPKESSPLRFFWERLKNLSLSSGEAG